MVAAKKKPSRSFVPFLLIALFIVWGALWATASFELRREIDAWAEAERAKGRQVEIDEPDLSGFPMSVVWHFETIKWRGANDAAVEASDVSLSVQPWNWRKIHFEIDDTKAASLPIPTPKSRLSLDIDSADGDFATASDGSLRLAALELLDTVFKTQNGVLFKADGIELTLASPAKLPDSYKDTGLNVKITGRGILMEELSDIPLGNRIAAANALIRVMGPPPDFTDKKAILKWNDESGVFECDSLNLVWGPLTAEMKGTLALTSTLQPEGAFSGRVMGIKQAIQSLADAGALEKRQANALKATLGLFAKPVPHGKEGEVEIPLSIQQNALSIGPVRLLTFPQLEF
jgi:hypothetical protein